MGLLDGFTSTHLGFPSKLCEWILVLICTSSSRVLLNCIVGDPIKHGRGLRQGDLLSPLSLSWPFTLSTTSFGKLLNKDIYNNFAEELPPSEPPFMLMMSTFL
jgi:hypothetical protein